jgi:hypothetical protein
MTFKFSGKLLTVFAGFVFFGLTSCGIEEYYFLPQVPQERITRVHNTEATILAPPISQFYYALNYSIFYKIYISSHHTESGGEMTPQERGMIHPSLASDFDAIFPSTDPTNTTASTAINNLFRNRHFYELELEGVEIRELLSTSGGNIRILFPTAAWDFPVLFFENSQGYRLSRNRDLISAQPVGDLSFRNTEELSNPANANVNVNADVAGRTGLTQHFAYVSMYIVAVGLDPVLFTPIFSRPTHISIFRLPETN